MDTTQKIRDVKLGKEVSIRSFVNLYECEIGEETKVGCFVEIQKGVKIGKRCKIQPFAFIPEGVVLEDEVFIGPHACFTNDKHPRSTTKEGKLKTGADWKVESTIVKKRASIGANATILCGITIGESAMVAAGAVVTKDVPAETLVAGNPAKTIRRIED